MPQTRIIGESISPTPANQTCPSFIDGLEDEDDQTIGLINLLNFAQYPPNDQIQQQIIVILNKLAFYLQWLKGDVLKSGLNDK